MGRQTPLPVALLVCTLLVTTAVVMTVKSLALAADGSYYLVRILGRDAVFGTDSRYLGNAVREGPVLLATHLGATDTHLLSTVFGVGMLIVPALVWSAAILFARPQRLAFAAVALTAGLCASMTWFSSVSESVLSAPLTVLVAVLLWKPDSWSRGLAAVAVLASVLLVASYETALLTGSVLAAWAVVRSRRAREAFDRHVSAFVALLSVLSVVVALIGSRTGKNSTHSKSLLYFVVSLEPWPFYVGLFGITLVIVALGPWLFGTIRWLVLALGCVSTLLGAWSLDPTPVAAFEARGGTVVAVFALQLFLLSCWTARRECSVAPPLSTWSLALPVLFVTAFLVASSRGLGDWSRSIDAFRARVDTVSGVAGAPDVLRPDERAALWSWTSTSLSLILRRDPGGGVLVDRNPSFVPFPPARAKSQLPDRFVWRG